MEMPELVFSVSSSPQQARCASGLACKRSTTNVTLRTRDPGKRESGKRLSHAPVQHVGTEIPLCPWHLLLLLRGTEEVLCGRRLLPSRQRTVPWRGRARGGAGPRPGVGRSSSWGAAGVVVTELRGEEVL